MLFLLLPGKGDKNKIAKLVRSNESIYQKLWTKLFEKNWVEQFRRKISIRQNVKFWVTFDQRFLGVKTQKSVSDVLMEKNAISHTQSWNRACASIGVEQKVRIKSIFCLLVGVSKALTGPGLNVTGRGGLDI